MFFGTKKAAIKAAFEDGRSFVIIYHGNENTRRGEIHYHTAYPWQIIFREQFRSLASNGLDYGENE